MAKTKLISLLSNIAILTNLVVGFLNIHWVVIGVFIVIHASLRLAYITAENQANHNPNAATSIAPPAIRNIASVITAIILAVVVYAIGYGVAYLLT